MYKYFFGTSFCTKVSIGTFFFFTMSLLFIEYSTTKHGCDTPIPPEGDSVVVLLSLTSIHIGQMLKIPGTLDGGDTGTHSSSDDENSCPEMSNEYVSDAHNRITLSALALR